MGVEREGARKGVIEKGGWEKKEDTGNGEGRTKVGRRGSEGGEGGFRGLSQWSPV